MYEELKKAAEAATPGEWRAGNAYDKPFVPKYEVIVDTQDGPYVILSGNHNFIEDAEANIAFVAAANPSAVLALIAENNKNACRLEVSEDTREVIRACLKAAETEIDQLKEEVTLDNKIIAGRDRLLNSIPACPAYGACVPHAIEWVEKAMLMMRELKAENEALRKDAERYRWLCNGHGYFMEEEMLCHITDEKAAADLAIDTRMLEEAGH